MSRHRAKTPDEVAWLKANCESMCNEDCLDGFELAFGWRMSGQSLRTWMYRNGLHVKDSRKKNTFTIEQREWLKERKWWYSDYDTMYADFAKDFEGTEKTREDIRKWMKCHGRSIGEPKKFRKGQKPRNILPVGTERVWKGITYVKCYEPDYMRDERKTHEGWRIKAHVLWEEANGRPFPEGHLMRYADGDPSNLAIDNLVPVPLVVNGALATLGIKYNDKDSLETAIEIANLTRLAKAKCKEAGVSWERVRKEAASG